jgi:hypothetical protein
MRRFLISVLVLFLLGNIVKSQNSTKLDDFGRIVLNTYLSEQMDIPAEARKLLDTKLSQVASNYGMGGSSVNPRFILTATINVGTKDIIAGPPQMIAQNIDVTIFIGDALENKIFCNTILSLKGVGTNENKAFLNAIKSINSKNQNIHAFIEEGKSKIIDFYYTQCDFILKEAESYAVKGEYDAAILKIAAIPDICEECYVAAMNKMEEIYQQKIDKECLLILREANNIWLANPNENGAEKVSEVLNKVSPFSTCEPDVSILMSKIENKLEAIEKANWDFKMKKYNDALELKEKQINLQEEALKQEIELKEKQINLQEEALKQEVELKEKQLYLEKEAQKQEYALKKAEQEVGGFKGFVNSVVKLKMSLWREDSDDYITRNNIEIDYSKFSLK